MDATPSFATNFSGPDWVIVVVYLALTVGIGVVANRVVRDMSDYMVAGRSLRSFLGVATLVGSELGLVTVMYAGQTGFNSGFAAFHIGLIAGVVAAIVGLTGFIVVPLRELGVKTIPEFYERRYGVGVRVVGGLVLAGAGILNMGLFLKLGAVFVTGLTGMQDPIAVKWVMTVLIVLVLVYTILGGMVSVVITDYLQFVVLSLGLLASCLLATQRLGWNNLFDTVAEVRERAAFDPFDGAGFGPSYVVWMLFTAGLVSCAVWQTAVLRACSAESASVVKRLYLWSSIGFMIRFILPQFLGICAFVFFWQDDAWRSYFFDPELATSTQSERSLEALPMFLAQVLPAGLIGVVGAGMLAAFMSTHDSYLLCWASVLAEDVVYPLSGKTLQPGTRLLLARLFIVVIGVFLLVWSLWYPVGQGLWDYMAITGAIYAVGAFALLVLGLYWRGGSRVGAYAALAAGLLPVLGLEPVRERVQLPEAITGAHIGLTAVSAALVLMVVLSLLFPDPPRTENAASDGVLG